MYKQAQRRQKILSSLRLFWGWGGCRFGVQEVLGYLPRHNPALTGILCVLVALHAYWFSLIAAIAWSKVTTGTANDTREEDE